jgi:hypothetical protein
VIHRELKDDARTGQRQMHQAEVMMHVKVRMNDDAMTDLREMH